MVALNCDVNFPLSYRFLRRYSRTAGLDMQTLTLARYVLETSLLFYEFICVPDSLMAAAALLLSMRMIRAGEWVYLKIYFSTGLDFIFYIRFESEYLEILNFINTTIYFQSIKLIKYSGYKVEHIEPLMWRLNHMMKMRSKVYPACISIEEKYSHP